MTHPLEPIIAERIAKRLPWWVNVYAETQREPLDERAWHPTRESADRAWQLNLVWGERPLYAVRVTPKPGAFAP